MSNLLYKEIIQKQIKHKYKYYKYINPPIGGFCMVIKNNLISKILYNRRGLVNKTREKQYIKLIQNVLSKYKLDDCNININLSDIPIKGYFNFCRNKNKDFECFLLPNHRFQIDDIYLDHKQILFDNFDFQKEYIYSKHKTEQIKKIYTSCIPHNSKINYFKYSLNNIDICDGYVYTGSTHGKLDLSDETYLKLKDNNMAGEISQDWIKHLDYKYVLYNDGNSLSDRMRLLLCTNSIIIKQKTNYEEFYSYLLKDKINYIEYNDISEIRKIIETNEKTNEYESIIENNKNFVNKYLNYNEILNYTYLIIKNICT